MPKLILTDLDHTLLRSDGTISKETLHVLDKCRAKGILTAVATARYWIGAEYYLEQIKPDYEITTDGTLVHAADRCIYSCTFTEEETNGLIDAILKSVPTAEITVAEGKTVYWNSRHIAESEKLHKAVFRNYDTFLACSANKVAAELPKDEIARNIARKFNCILQCYRGENWYAFLPNGAGKMPAIHTLAEKCGIGLHDIIAFGDDINDVDMLKACGTGVAVANAVQEVLDIADCITSSNDEDGVAKWLMANCL